MWVAVVRVGVVERVEVVKVVAMVAEAMVVVMVVEAMVVELMAEVAMAVVMVVEATVVVVKVAAAVARGACAAKPSCSNRTAQWPVAGGKCRTCQLAMCLQSSGDRLCLGRRASAAPT